MKSIKILEKIFPSMTDLHVEEQNIKYEGLRFFDPHQNQSIRSRLAKKTEKKAGYFVTFWEKDKHNKNQAYSFKESPDLILVLINDQEKQGAFFFPKEVLRKKKILRDAFQKGKMGIRVYPPFCKNLNQTALKTQAWQNEYYKEIK